MNYLSKVKSIPRNLPTGLESGSGIKPFLKDKVERAAFSAALGAAKGYYFDKMVWRGIGAEAWIGVLSYLGSALVGGSSSKHLERLGDAGLMNYVYATAASWGSDKAGRGTAVSKKQVPGKKSDVVGVIPPRGGGAFLTPDEIANYSSPR